jgi:tRNA modification GTPase
MLPHYLSDDTRTIAAIATAPGEGAIAIVRLSGKNAFSITNKIFSKDITKYKSHTSHFGKIINNNGEAIDSVLLLIMKGPKSFTGEDSVEIHCHGGSFVTKQVLATAIDAGAIAAEPGEFTYRAYKNNKIDLAQAEAIQKLIHAKNKAALMAANAQLEGSLSAKISSFQQKLTHITAIIEAWVDFPEEGLEFASLDEILQNLTNICDDMTKLEKTFHDGKILFDGASLAIIGPPNVGKSTLMNVFIGNDRAIVTPVAGTTRDTLEEAINLGPFHIKLIDTAGIRETKEEIEAEGIKRAKKSIETADIILLVLDATKKLDEEALNLIDECKSKNTIIVWNKTDITPATETINHTPILSISAKMQIGIDGLKKAIEHSILKNDINTKEEIIITKLRHKQALTQSITSSKAAIKGLENNMSPEFIAEDLKLSLNTLATIIGTDVTEDILSSIFSTFCIGK